MRRLGRHVRAPHRPRLAQVPRGRFVPAALRSRLNKTHKGGRPIRRAFARNGFENDSLSAARLDRCARYCLDPYPHPKHAKSHIPQRVPPCARPGDTESQPAGVLLAAPEASRLPPYLMQHRKGAMAEFFAYFTSSA